MHPFNRALSSRHDELAAEIETLIRARYPILYLITSEEMRVQNMLVEIAGKRQKKVFEWTYSSGMFRRALPFNRRRTQYRHQGSSRSIGSRIGRLSRPFFCSKISIPS